MAKHKWEMVCPRPKDLVVPVRTDPKGALGPTKSAARGSAWRQTSHGFYVPATTPRYLPEQRIVEQSVRLPAFGAVTGWAACRLHRANFFDGLGPDGKTLIPVPLALGRRGNIRGDGQVSLNYDLLAPDEVTVAAGTGTPRIWRRMRRCAAWVLKSHGSPERICATARSSYDVCTARARAPDSSRRQYDVGRLAPWPTVLRTSWWRRKSWVTTGDFARMGCSRAVETALSCETNGWFPAPDRSLGAARARTSGSGSRPAAHLHGSRAEHAADGHLAQSHVVRR